MASVTVRGFSLCAPACSLLFSGWMRPTCSQICSSAGANLLQDWFIQPLLSLQFAVNLPVATFGSLREVFLFSVLHICCCFQRDLANAGFLYYLFAVFLTSVPAHYPSLISKAACSLKSLILCVLFHPLVCFQPLQPTTRIRATLSKRNL